MQKHNRLLLNSVTSLLVGCSALGTCLVEDVAGQTSPAKPAAASPAETAPGRASSKPSETSKDAPEKSTADSESARKVRDRLRTQFAEQDPKELAEAARALGNEAKAKFQFGRQIAVWQAREIRMTEQRLELRKQAEQKTQDRAKVRTQLDKEIEQTQQQFKADKAQCEWQLTELIQSYRPRLQQLKDEAARATELANKTDAKLADIRRNIQSLEQQSRLVAQGKPAAPPRVLIVDLELEDKDDPYKLDRTSKAADTAAKGNTTTKATTAAKPVRSVEEMLKELD